jgi:DNA polymerase I-like protein with 3'-5' exonuclease and polymerase domains
MPRIKNNVRADNATAVELPGFVSRPDSNRYFGDNYLVLDFETEVNDGRFGSALDVRNHLSLACWRTSSGVYRSHWGGEFDQADLVAAIKAADFIVGHNIKYELGWLARCGVDLSKLLCFDTQLAEYVLLGNLAAGDPDNGVRRVSLSLDNCGLRRSLRPKDAIIDLWMQHGIKVSEMPKRWVEMRCKQDVETTHSVFLDQRTRLARTNRLGVLYTRCLFTPVLAEIEAEGMHLDALRVSQFTEDYRVQLRALETEFAATTGGINFRSPKQVGEYLYDKLGFPEPRGRDGRPKRTSKGKRLTNRKILDKLTATTDEQRNFLALKRAIGKVSAALSKNLEYFEEICNERNGTFHAEFNQSVTATHRLSCTGIKECSDKSVQLQNVPRDFKCLFTAKRDGWLIGEADGAQAEFRGAAHLGADSQAKRDIADRTWDAHCVTASEMYVKPYDELRAAYLAGDKGAANLRQLAKPDTFKPLYGGSKGTKEQERWYKAFRERYPELAKAQEDWVHEVLASKRLITEWGMRYYFPHAKLSSSGYCNVGSAVYNYPVQALATAEIIPISIAYAWHQIHAEGMDSYIVPVSTVHDSLICEVHPDHTQDFRRIACDSFGIRTYDYLRTVYHLDYSVPLGIGIKLASHWSEGKEELYEYFNGKTERVK